MKKVFLIFSLLSMVFLLNTNGQNLMQQLGISPSSPLGTDKPRVTIGDVNGYGKTVLTYDGELLRGNAVWLWRAKIQNGPSQLQYALEESYYKMLKDSGINFIRLCIYAGAHVFTSNVTDYNNVNHVNTLLEYTNAVVDYASKYGMYVMLNYHDVGQYKGEYGNFNADNMGYIKDFWSFWAPYYKDRTHVFYEPVNEPRHGSSNFTNDVLNDMDELYHYVRPLAPETHLSLLCITGAVSKSWDSQSMVDVMDRYIQLHPNSVDWSNASVAFHPYTTDEKVYSSQPIQDVMADYPVLNSEAHYPCDPSIKDQIVGSEKQCQTVDGELFINQTMERLGVSWNMHKSLGYEYFPYNWPFLLADANEKGYIWFDYDGGGGYDDPGDDDEPGGDNNVTIQAENEDAKSGVSKASNHSGYNGSGFLDYGGQGTWAEWTLDANITETVTLSVRYALGYGDRPCEVTVDGTSVGTLDFPVTGGWSTWETSSIDIDVTKGANVIRITAGSNAGPNIDELVFSGSEITKYDLSVSATNGYVELDPASGSYLEDEIVTVTAIADDNYSFSDWDGASESTDNPIQITMDGDKSLTANFALDQYTLSTNINNNAYGSISVNPDQTVFDYGTDVTITATPESGYEFDNWSGASNSTETSITLTMDSDKSITANFSVITVDYTLTTSATNGSIVLNPSNSENIYDEGTTVTATANPSNGYHFTDWDGASESTGNPVDIVLDSDKSLTANFDINYYTLTTNVNNSSYGSINVNPDQSSYIHGSTVTLTANAAEGYEFDDWSGASSSTDFSIDLVMDSDKSITANFSVESEDPWYDLTSTYFCDYFSGTTLNSSDFTWHADGKEWTGISFSSNDELIASNAGNAWHTITLTFADGVTVDISGNPIVSFKAKTTATSDLTYELRLEDANGKNTYSSNSVTLIGDGQYHEYDITISSIYKWDPTQVKEVQLYYGDQASVPCEIYIDEFELGGDLKSGSQFYGLNDQDLNTTVDVYPNPVKDNMGFVVEVKGFDKENSASLRIFDVTGKQVYMFNLVTLEKSVVKHSLPTQNLPGKGMYVIVISNENKVITSKLVVD